MKGFLDLNLLDAAQVKRIDHTFSKVKLDLTDHETFADPYSFLLGIGEGPGQTYHVMLYPDYEISDPSRPFPNTIVHFKKFKSFEAANKLRNRIESKGELPDKEYWIETDEPTWLFSTFEDI